MRHRQPGGGSGSGRRVSAPHAAILKTSEEPQGSPLSSCALPVLFSHRFSTFLSSGQGSQLCSCSSHAFFPPLGGTSQVLLPFSLAPTQGGHDPGPTLSPAPSGASWPCVPGEPQRHWDTRRAPPAELGLGPPRESLRGAPTPCACPWGWDQGPQRGLATCGGPALPAASSRREAAKHRLWQRAAGRGTRKAQSEARPQPAAFHFCPGLQRCFVPLCQGWDGRTPEPTAGWHRKTPPIPAAACPQTGGSGAALGAPPGRLISGGAGIETPSPCRSPVPLSPLLGGGCAWRERGSPAALGASPARPGFVHPSERRAGWGCASGGRPVPRRRGTEPARFCLTPVEAEGTRAQRPVTVLEADTAAQ